MEVILLDMNSICHAAHNGTKLTTATGFQTQAVYGALRSIRMFRQQYPEAKFQCLWDGRAQWRIDIYPEYKANRKATKPEDVARKEAYKKQMPLVMAAVKTLGLDQIKAMTHEADDLAGIMATRLGKVGRKVRLITGDRDWLQLVGPTVTWYDPIRDRTVGHSNFMKETGYFSQDEFVEGKALMGDTSDNIDGVGGIGEKGAPEFLAQFKSVWAFLREVDAGTLVPKKKAHQRLASPEGRAIFERNYKLMNLRSVPAPKEGDLSMIRGEFNADNFRAICETLNFNSVLREFDQWISTFNKETI